MDIADQIIDTTDQMIGIDTTGEEEAVDIVTIRTQMEEGDTIAIIQINKETEVMNGRC